MKKTLSGIFAFMVVMMSSQAANYLTVDFSTGFTDGNLVGQNAWLQTGTTATTPIQYSSALGAAVLGTSGQDIYKGLTTQASKSPDGSSLLTRIDFKITAAQAAGDHFFGISDPLGTTSNFYTRLFARSSSTGFNLGINLSGTTTAGGTQYGNTVFNFNQTYTAVLAWDFVTGTLNDTLMLYINPNSNIRNTLTSEVTGNWVSTTAAEPTTISAVNLRQGSAANAPSVNVTYISVGNTLGEVGIIPEPSSSMLMVLGAGALIGIHSLRRKQS